MKSKINLKLAAIQFCVLAAYASYFNFFILYIKEQGFSTFGAGIIQAIIACLTFLYQPVLGHIIDRYLGYKKGVGISMGMIIAIALIIPYVGSMVYVLGGFVVFHAVVMRQIPMLVDGWTVAIKISRTDVSYEKTRSLGSIGAGLASIVVGTVIARFGYDKIFWLNALFVGSAFIMTFFLEDQKKEVSIKQNQDFKSAFSHLLRNRVYMTFMLSAFVLNIGIKIVNMFGPIMMENVGGNSEVYGYAMFICGIAEAFTFGLTAYLMRRTSLKNIYILAILSMGVGSMLMFSTGAISLFVIGRCVLGMTYSFYIAMVVAYVRELVEPKRYGIGMGVLLAGTGGIAQIFSSLGGGLVLEILDLSGVLYVMLGLTLISLIIFIGNFGKGKKNASR